MCDLQQSLLAVSLQNTDQEQEMGGKGDKQAVWSMVLPVLACKLSHWECRNFALDVALLLFSVTFLLQH